MKNKKVLIVVDHIGGEQAKSFAWNLYEQRKKIEDFDLKFFSLRKTKNDPDESEDLFISKSSNKYNIRSFFELKKVMDRENINIIQPVLQRSLIFCLLIKKMFFPKIRLIHHEHGKIFQNSSWYNIFLSLFSKEIDLSLAVSEATEQKIIQNTRILKEKVKVLHNFIDLDRFSPEKYNKNEERKKLGLRRDDFVIGFIGRLDPIKNVDKLIKSIPLLRTHLENVKLVIVGDGPQRGYLASLAKNLNVSENVMFLGYREDIPPLISAFDVGCLVSDHESFGMPILEFLAMNKPILTTETGIAKEIENLCIKKIEFADPNLIASVLMNMKERKVGARGRRVAKKFSTNKQLERLEHIFNNLR